MSTHLDDRTSTAPQREHPNDSIGGPILVWMDDSYEAGEALGWAARVARACSSPLVATRSWSPRLGEFRGEGHRCALERRREELTGWCVPARDEGVEPDIDVVEVVEGVGAVDVLAEADRRHASMVVRGIGLSTHHRAASEAGARKLLEDCPSAVGIVPVAGAARPLRRIMVALEEDDLVSTGVQEWASRLRTAAGATLHLAYVMPYQAEWVPASDPRSIWSTSEEALHRSWRDVVEAGPTTTELHLLEAADPVGAWTSVAHQCHVDLIIAPVHRGRGPFHQRRSTRVLRLARESGLAVLAVPA